MSKSREHCAGCDQNFYNGNNPHGVKECWSLRTAKVVTRFKQPWWEAWPFGSARKVRTYDCHTETGKYGFAKVDPRPSKAALRAERGES